MSQLSGELHLTQEQVDRIHYRLRGEDGDPNPPRPDGVYVSDAGHGLLAVRFQHQQFSRVGAPSRTPGSTLPTVPYQTLLLDEGGEEVHRHDG